MLVNGFRIQDKGYRIQDSGYRIQDTGFRIQDSGYRIQDKGYRILPARLNTRLNGFIRAGRSDGDTGRLRLFQPGTFKRFKRLNLFMYLTRKMKFNIGVVLYLGI